MRIHAFRGTATMTEADDLTRLALVISGARADALGDWGRWIDDDHVAVHPSYLRALAGELATEAGWRERFAAMVRHAADHGWLDEQGEIRMHVE